MLSPQDIKEYRKTRGLKLREVSEYAKVFPSDISNIENGKKHMTKFIHDKIVNGINKAFFAKFGK